MALGVCETAMKTRCTVADSGNASARTTQRSQIVSYMTRGSKTVVAVYPKNEFNDMTGGADGGVLFML